MTPLQAYHHQLALRALRMDEADHAAQVYAEGLRYLDLYMEGMPMGRRTLEGMPEYWAWWKRQWARRTVQWSRTYKVERLLPLMGPWERALLARTWNWTHDAQVLHVVEQVQLSRSVLRLCNQHTYHTLKQ